MQYWRKLPPHLPNGFRNRSRSKNGHAKQNSSASYRRNVSKRHSGQKDSMWRWNQKEAVLIRTWKTPELCDSSIPIDHQPASWDVAAFPRPYKLYRRWETAFEDFWFRECCYEQLLENGFLAGGSGGLGWSNWSIWPKDRDLSKLDHRTRKY